MTEIATQLLATFETLPAAQQHEIVTQLLRRTGGLPESTLTDDDLTAVADDLFLMLDAEEADGNNAPSR
jgi:hypothetical protein